MGFSPVLFTHGFDTLDAIPMPSDIALVKCPNNRTFQPIIRFFIPPGVISEI